MHNTALNPSSSTLSKMKFSVPAAALGALSCMVLADTQAHMSFEDYVKLFNKQYACAKSRAAAKAAFDRRATLIERHNRLYKEGKALYEMEFNRWTDVPKAVLASYMGYEHRDLKHAGYGPVTGKDGTRHTRSLHAIDGVITKEQILAPHDKEIGLPCHHNHHHQDEHPTEIHAAMEEQRAIRKFKELPRHVDWRKPMRWPRGSQDAGPRKSAVTPVKVGFIPSNHLPTYR